MARFDKFDPKSGGFRAPLAADRAATSKTGNGNPLGVGFDVNGRLVAGAGQAASGVKGLLVTTTDKKATEVVDVMTHGEITDFVGVAGTSYYVNPADGVVSADPDAGGVGTGIYVGHTVEATRLIVRIETGLGAG